MTRREGRGPVRVEQLCRIVADAVVEHDRDVVYEKLQVHSKSDAVAKALRNRLVL